MVYCCFYWTRVHPFFIQFWRLFSLSIHSILTCSILLFSHFLAIIHFFALIWRGDDILCRFLVNSGCFFLLISCRCQSAICQKPFRDGHYLLHRLFGRHHRALPGLHPRAQRLSAPSKYCRIDRWHGAVVFPGP